MDSDVAYAYTGGLSTDDVERHLRERAHGVLSLADGDTAYAFPVYHHYDDGSLFFRLGLTADSEKRRYLAATAQATYVVYETAHTEDPAGETGWSIVARGPLSRVPDDDPAYEAVEINDRYDPIRIFDEDLDDVSVVLYELVIEELTGRAN